jgi:hypothetical protein
MVTLSEWIESANEEIITLSMGILVNLCYKNLPAIYTLMGNVDVKKIVQICSAMRVGRKLFVFLFCNFLFAGTHYRNSHLQVVDYFRLYE